MQHMNVRTRTLAALVIAPLAIGLFQRPACAQATDGVALAAQCAARDWNIYMNCQRELLAARHAGDYCVPGADNAARYQIEFVRFARENPAAVNGIPAAAAAAAYFSRHHRCD